MTKILRINGAIASMLLAGNHSLDTSLRWYDTGGRVSCHFCHASMLLAGTQDNHSLDTSFGWYDTGESVMPLLSCQHAFSWQPLTGYQPSLV